MCGRGEDPRVEQTPPKDSSSGRSVERETEETEREIILFIPPVDLGDGARKYLMMTLYLEFP